MLGACDGCQGFANLVDVERKRPVRHSLGNRQWPDRHGCQSNAPAHARPTTAPSDSSTTPRPADFWEQVLFPTATKGSRSNRRVGVPAESLPATGADCYDPLSRGSEHSGHSGQGRKRRSDRTDREDVMRKNMLLTAAAGVAALLLQAGHD